MWIIKDKTKISFLSANWKGEGKMHITSKITSKNNDMVKLYSALSASASKRRSLHLFVIEGRRLCHEAYLSGIKIEAMFYTPEFCSKYSSSAEEIAARAENVYETTEDILKKIADTVTPQGIVCICRRPEHDIKSVKFGGFYIALENVSDPSNIGAIARSAAAFNYDGIMLTRGSADIYSPKALRASMGALLRLPVIEFIGIEKILETCRKSGITSYAGVVSRDAENIYDVDFSGGTLIMVGNEGHGLSTAAINGAEQKIFIPMSAKTESLNAAAAASIMMWESRKKSFI